MPYLPPSGPLIPILVFLGLTLSDYYLTIYGARLYRSGANEIIHFEGSYELNPTFVPDIDRDRLVSPRLLLLLAVYSLVLGGVWYLSVSLLGLVQLFTFVVGIVVLIQGPLHLRHFRNIFAFRRAVNREGVDGRVEYSRAFSYAASALELLSFAGLYVVLAVAASSWLLAGGAFGCATYGLGSYRLARKAAPRDSTR